MRAQLMPLHAGTAVEISRDLTVIGRREDCDLRLDHKGVSKLHCVLVKADGMLLLRDLGSTNGTRVNGQRIRRAALMSGDEIRIAGVSFRVTITPGEVPASPHEHTQQLGSAELESLRQPGKPGEPQSPVPVVSVRINSLPDVYPGRDKEHEQPE